MRSRIGVYIIATTTLALWLGWILFAVAIIPNKSKLSLGELGNFGDSFGVISGLTSSFAVIFAIYTTSLQNKSSDRQQFENNFYNMIRSLEHSRDNSTIRLLNSNHISKYFSRDAKYFRLKNAGREDLHIYTGARAFQISLLRLRDQIGENGFRDSKIVHNLYTKSVQNGNFFSNYFRILYHIYQMMESLPIDEAAKYSRIARAHLSNNEICLIGYNLSVGEGRLKFKKLANKYKIMHNIKSSDLDPYEKAELDFFVRKIGFEAFSFEEEEPFTYDS